MHADDLGSAQLNDPNGGEVFEDMAKGPLKDQKPAETFAESAEPVCWPHPDADHDEEIVTLEEFLERWATGTYTFSGMGDGGKSRKARQCSPTSFRQRRRMCISTAV
jgi:hypothetical protein